MNAPSKTSDLRALTHFDSDGFRDHLAELVAIPSTSHDPGHEADVQRYLADAIQPWLERMGFAVEIHPNPIRGFPLAPRMVAELLAVRAIVVTHDNPAPMGARSFRATASAKQHLDHASRRTFGRIDVMSDPVDGRSVAMPARPS